MLTTLCPSELLTVTAVGPSLFAGVTAVNEVVLITFALGDGVLPKLTVAPLAKPVPVIATLLPPVSGPDDGLMLVITGGGFGLGPTLTPAPAK